MQQFEIRPNSYVRNSTRAFFSVPYVCHNRPGNPDYLNDLKNTYGNFSDSKLNSAAEKLKLVLMTDLPQIFMRLGLAEITACVVPRAKADNNFSANQLRFRSTVSSVVSGLPGFADGSLFLRRHTNTFTTHFRKDVPNYINDGDQPYPGITAATCSLSPAIRGIDILLIDDIYTKDVGIDEDAIQALWDAGAKSVAFYAIAKTGGNCP